MNVVQVSASLSRAAGGIFEIELALSKHLVEFGVKSHALGLVDAWWKTDSCRWTPVPAEAFPVVGPLSFGYSPRLIRELLTTDAEIGHLHTLWMYPGVALEKWSRIRRRPYVVTPNGMLEPWALRHSAWKKKIAAIMYEKRVLVQASCIQANTPKELHDIRNFGCANAVAIIPNGVSLPATQRQERNSRKRRLLYLGRMHPKKGLISALRAWKLAKDNHAAGDWQFVIAGWDQGGHEAELKRLCNELDLPWSEAKESDLPDTTSPIQSGPNPAPQTRLPDTSIIFAGPAFGGNKDTLMRQADAFILPSFSEGLPMAVLEAWAYGLPVLMTEHCNLPEGYSADAAVQIGTDPASIAAGLNDLFSAPSPLLAVMGANGRRLVEEKFAWPEVARQMKEVYAWALGGGSAPGCVST